MSFHVLVVLADMRAAGLVASASWEASGVTYFPTETFSAVLPLPKRSYAAPSRGVRPSTYGTPVTRVEVNRVDELAAWPHLFGNIARSASRSAAQA